MTKQEQAQEIDRCRQAIAWAIVDVKCVSQASVLFALIQNQATAFNQMFRNSLDEELNDYLKVYVDELYDQIFALRDSEKSTSN